MFNEYMFKEFNIDDDSYFGEFTSLIRELFPGETVLTNAAQEWYRYKKKIDNHEVLSFCAELLMEYKLKQILPYLEFANDKLRPLNGNPDGSVTINFNDDND